MASEPQRAGSRSGAGGTATAAGEPAAAAGDPPKKGSPKLRGAIHHYAVFVAAAIGVMLILDAQTSRARWGCVVYSISTTAMFGASALYHRPNWNDRARAVFRRLDHACIFLLIAGTNTPLALLALPPEQAKQLLTLVWTGAGAGILQCLLFSRASKWLAATLYVALGWAALPFLQQYRHVLPNADVALIVSGGVVYSIGALVYAARRPDPVPHVFGYHEIFHVFVTVAALLHFVAVYRVVNGPLGAPPKAAP